VHKQCADLGRSARLRRSRDGHHPRE
jgi:hypothetical protein